jgi:ketosteroid isomerase-like protein
METKEFETLPEITVRNISAEGDIVMVQSTGKAIGKTGKPFDASYCDVYRLQNGKIKEFTTYVIETTY